MSNSGENDIWTAQRLGARLAALKGLAPPPSCYIVWRSTSVPGAPDVPGYELPGESVRRDEPGFERWLTEQGLAGAERLSVSVLLIREQLDDAGLVREAVLERRRGGAEGPYYGNVARVEFVGAANRVRRYRASRDGRLTELPAEDDPGTPSPADDLDAESFAGEDAAVQAYLGAGAVILDRRAPTLFEDLAGLSGIVHARRWDGAEIGCGVGWHGGTAFVLAADFPRHARPLAAPPDLDAAVDAALQAEDLTRYETRLDERGFCVIARRRGRQTLVVLRLDDGQIQIEPYLPGRISSANEDQRRWMIYAETYEARTVIDSWRTGDGEDIAVLTVDPDNEAWRHIVDTDGIEISRRSDNEAAAAVLWRERIALPEAPPARPDAVPAAAPTPEAAPPADTQAAETAPADSLLTKVRAYLRVTALLRDAAVGDRPAALTRLHALTGPLNILNANFSAGSLHRLLSQGDTMTGESFAAALDELATRLRDELALTRIVVLPSAQSRLAGEPPFGPMVEVQFPSAAYDIEEAVHCLALRRTTAAVLHAMKVMRHGLRGVERLLDTPKLTELSWPRLIAVVRAATGEGHRPLLEALVRVRRSWHGPGLMPADKYTDEEAEAVLEAVAAFMRELAASFDALGETPAE